MHSNHPVVADTCKDHIDHSAKIQFRVFNNLAWRCLAYLLLTATHTSLIAEPGIADEQHVTPDLPTDIAKFEQGLPGRLKSEPVITWENGIYTLFDSQRREHAFRQLADGRYGAFKKSSGKLSQTVRGQFRWIDNAGQLYLFEGSTLARSQHMATLQMGQVPGARSYQAQQVPEPNINITRAALSNSHECTPTATTQTEGPVSSTDTPPQPSDEDPPTPASNPTNPINQPDEPLQCDTDTAGPHTFQRIPYRGSQITLDARPGSCESYFVQYYGTDRGFEIEAGLHLHSPYKDMQPTVRNFPVIDFMDESRLVVVHSRDLGNRTFNSTSRPDALLDQLLKDGEQIQTRFVDVLHEQGSISANERGQSTTIRADQLRPITLQLVVRDGIASADHWRQIEIARERLMRLYGITLEVVVIP